MLCMRFISLKVFGLEEREAAFSDLVCQGSSGLTEFMAHGTLDTGGEVKEEDWTSSISIENERFAAYL